MTKFGARAIAALLLVGACTAAPTAPLANASDERPGWQVMPHIKLATFSASDPGEYDLMIFCDSDNHVRLYHLVPSDEPSAALTLRSGSARVVLASQRELVRITPPPVAVTDADDEAVLGARLSARLERTAPVWRTFAETGALEVQSGAHVTNADAKRSEQAALASLFSECPQ